MHKKIDNDLFDYMLVNISTYYKKTRYEILEKYSNKQIITIFGDVLYMKKQNEKR